MIISVEALETFVDPDMSSDNDQSVNELPSFVDHSIAEKHFINTIIARNDALEKELKELQSKYSKVKTRFNLETHKISKIKTSLGKFFGIDQIKHILGTKCQWTRETMKKAIVIKAKEGPQLLNFVRKKIAPLPSLSTIKKNLKNLKFRPGILKFNIQTLASDTKSLPAIEKRFLIAFDEKAIIPGVSKEQVTNEFVGCCTLPKTKEKAVNALVFLAMGIAVRFKRVIGYHFTAKSIDPQVFHDFLIDLLVTFEKISGCVYKIFILT